MIPRLTISVLSKPFKVCGILSTLKSRDSLADVVTRVQAGRNGVRILAGTSDSSAPKRQNRLWDTPYLLFNVVQG
jgi:hypothetical protein